MEISKELWERFCRDIFSDRCMDPKLDILHKISQGKLDDRMIIPYTRNSNYRWAYYLTKQFLDYFEFNQKLIGPIESKRVELVSVENMNLYFCVRVLYLSMDNQEDGYRGAQRELGTNYTEGLKINQKLNPYQTEFDFTLHDINDLQNPYWIERWLRGDRPSFVPPYEKETNFNQLDDNSWLKKKTKRK